jgi:hypothetical protein
VALPARARRDHEESTAGPRAAILHSISVLASKKNNNNDNNDNDNNNNTSNNSLNLLSQI